jgi:hypothetical protein
VADNNWKVHGFTQIPNLIIFCSDITPQAKQLYLILMAHCMKKDCCYPKMETLREELGYYDNKPVINAINELEEKGLIQVIRQTGKPNNYKLIKSDIRNIPFINERLPQILSIDSRDGEDTSDKYLNQQMPIKSVITTPRDYYVDDILADLKLNGAIIDKETLITTLKYLKGNKIIDNDTMFIINKSQGQ